MLVSQQFIADDLKGLPCIGLRFASERLYAWEFEQDGVELSVKVSGPLIVGDQDIMVDAALLGAGVAYAYEDQVEAHIREGRLIRVLEDWCPYYTGFYLYYRAGGRCWLHCAPLLTV